MEDIRAGRILSEGFIASSPEMKALRRYALTMAGCKDPLFIAGEKGTGKTHLARLVHEAGGRKGPFHVLSASPLLFGRAGDTAGRPAIEQAPGGTLCISCLGDINQVDQGRLLRFFESGQCRLEGSDSAKRIDVRIIFESLSTLDELMKTGRLRLDLYYHLKAHEIVIPPLRDRRSEISVLVEHFLILAAGEDGREDVRLPPKAEAVLTKHTYPGNVEELRDIIFDAVRKTPGHVVPARLFR